MKKVTLAILSILLTAPVCAQEMTVEKKNGQTESISLDSLQKLAFSNGNMVVIQEDGKQSNISISSIGQLKFQETTETPTIHAIEGRLEYSSGTWCALVTNSKGQTLSVYNLSGRAVMERPILSDSQEVDLSGLSKGVYLVKLGNKTVKIVR